LLLRRCYWKDNLDKIGKELGISYFDTFNNYWDMDETRASLEIARAVSDDGLIDILKKHKPGWYLSLMGFQGRYLSVSEDGVVGKEGAWDKVRQNVRTAFERWGDKAYGVLQAIVNKNGEAPFFTLVEEIYNVLGYGFYPSHLLPSLVPLRLVFKTGSNKYPAWTIPQETTPVVKEELLRFREVPKIRKKKPREKEPSISDRLLKLQLDIAALVDAIVEKRRNINFIFLGKYKTKFFRENEVAMTHIRKPCSSEEEFNNRIQSMAVLINEVERENLGKIVSVGQEGSLNLLEAILRSINPNFSPVLVKNLRNIITLRSKKFPTHADTPEFIGALRYFGFESFPPDWQELWEVVLRRYLESLELLEKELQTSF